MGFCDPAPDEAKHLRLHLLWHGRPYTASIADKVRYAINSKRTLCSFCACRMLLTSVIHKLNNCKFCCKRKVWNLVRVVDLVHTQERANLPSEAQLVTNEGEAAAILAAAAAEGLEAGSSPSEWRDNAAFARENHS